jgi:hypothetical protein
MGKLTITISQNAVFQAEAEISGCGSCTEAGCVPFTQVLDFLRNHSPGEVDYILSVFGRCPACGSPLSENTMVRVRQDQSNPI